MDGGHLVTSPLVPSTLLVPAGPLSSPLALQPRVDTNLGLVQVLSDRLRQANYEYDRVDRY